MRKKGAIIVLSALGLAALLGSGPCDEARLEDDLDALANFFSRTLRPGSVVNVFDKLAYWVGQDLDPTSIDMFSVTVRRIDDPAIPLTTPIPGTVEGFDFSQCHTSGYVVILEIFSWTDFDLASTSGWLNLRLLDGRDIRISLPQDAPGLIEAGQTLALYVASDGSTYYALDDDIFPDANPRTHDMMWGFCDWVGFGCPSLTPARSYDPATLAAPAGPTPSTTPLIIAGNAIDPAAGLNGGIIGEINNDQMIFVIAIESCPPYYGYDQLNNTFDFMLGGYTLAGGYVEGMPGYLDPNPQPFLYPNGVVFSPNNGADCDLNPDSDFELALQWLRLKDGSPLADIIVPFSTGPAPAGYALNPCVP